VRAIESRTGLRIVFPRVLGYRSEALPDRIHARFDERTTLALSTADVPSETQMLPIVGEAGRHSLDDLYGRRSQEVAFRLARRTLEAYWPEQPWLFPQILGITKSWLDQNLVLKDRVGVQLLLLQQLAERAADKIRLAIVRGQPEGRASHIILASADPLGSTDGVDFDTIKPAMPTHPEKSPISHVVCDTDSWEQRVALALEAHPRVRSYAKNERVGFEIPYAIDGEPRRYRPDFLARIDDRDDPADLLNVVIEVSGQDLLTKSAKVDAAVNHWVPGVNAAETFGRWAFLEVTDPWSAEGSVDGLLAAQGAAR
jgi:type III restriction enzyme